MKAFYTQRKLNKSWNNRKRTESSVVTPYIMTHCCAVLLDHFRWKQERVGQFLQSCQSHSSLIDAKICTVLDFNVFENYGIKLNFKPADFNKEKNDCSPQTRQMYHCYETMSDLLLNICVTILIKEFGWHETMVKRFCSLFNKYYPGLYHEPEIKIIDTLTRLHTQHNCSLFFEQEGKKYGSRIKA